MPVIAGIVAFFRFFKWSSVVDFFFKKVTFASMLVVNTIIAALLASYFAATLSSLNFIYEKINYIIKYINDFVGDSNDVVSLSVNILKSLGIWNAFVDVYNVFSPFLISLALGYVFKFGIKFFRNSRDILVSLAISKI